ncbi:hypothetical protein HYPSUDRAFT_427511 [Hypholoma sublateritium FD-334 SS-4]|uniref:Uncharacterized protein n=1 Tax=Hypholoma sublateritium (strain FD-334 SS-4) TaxID=945553 RepID=A0A0D2P2F3_HYPSF|nr:hypothetical protein HYPSUDRAFT_427511 [Hypholoma sublateritium FD-334 SS-4]
MLQRSGCWPAWAGPFMIGTAMSTTWLFNVHLTSAFRNNVILEAASNSSSGDQ